VKIFSLWENGYGYFLLRFISYGKEALTANVFFKEMVVIPTVGWLIMHGSPWKFIAQFSPCFCSKI
jgi:hypothetical protein